MPRTILIVDDMSINRHILRGMLSRDYGILEAADGEEALDILSREHAGISAVLLDISMPGIDGYEVLRRIRSDLEFSQMPVIMITGSEDEESRVSSLSLGANDYVMKPYSSEIIKHCLKNNIALREAAATVNTLERDKLTGVWNREAFFRRAALEVENAPAGSLVLGCVDIEGFKVINDQYGSEVGDRILKTMGEALQSSSDRYGGLCGHVFADSFVGLFPRQLEQSGLIGPHVLEKEILENTGISLTLSVGRYIIEDKSLGINAMFDRASIAKGTIKGRYDTHVALYDESMRDQMVREQSIVNDMKAALAGNQFEVWFQPQYNHSTAAMIGSEALVRWRHPEKGLIPPNYFIPIFERNGFIYSLDKFVWEEVCRNLRKWIDVGRLPLPVSVNISRYDILRPDVVGVLAGLVEKYGLPMEMLRLEITESAFSEASQHIVYVVKELLRRGFTVEIDDFGSGYSSLNTLKDVPAQIIKLDMKFLESSADSQRGGNIMESIVRMAKWLGMSVIAEGVETLQQADYLRSIGCNYMQGYYFARPMPVERYEEHCSGSRKEERLLTLETVENLDNNAFWDPQSMDTLIFNSYIGGACIYEYYNGNIELLRATEKYAQVIGSAGMTVEEALKLNWTEHLDEENRGRVIRDLERSVASKSEITGEYVFLDLPNCPHETFLRSTMRVIAAAGNRYLVYCTNENVTAQRQAERQAREAEQRSRELAEQMRSIMDNLPCGAGIYEFKGTQMSLTYQNKRYWELVGLNEEAFPDSAPMSAVHPDDIPLIMQELFVAIEQNRDVACNIRLRHLTQGYIPVCLLGRIVREKEGGFLIYATFTPAEQLNMSYQQTLPLLLSTIMEASNDYAFAKDKDFRYICCSPAFLRLAGLADECEVIGKTDFELFPPDMAEQFRQNDLALFESGNPLVDFEETVHAQDGEPHYCLASKHILRDASGNTIGIYGVSRDITKERSTLEQLQLVNDSIPGGIATYSYTNGNIRIMYCNDGFCELFGGTREGFMRRVELDPLDWVFEEDRAKLREQITALVSSDTPMDCVFRIHVIGGGFKWINEKAVAAEHRGDTILFNSILLDITERQNALEMLRISEEENNLAVQHGGSVVCRYDVGEKSLAISPSVAAAYSIPEKIIDVPYEPVRLGMISPESAKAYIGFFEEILSGGQEGTVLYQQSYFGTWRWMEAKSSTIFSNDGKPVRAVISLFDVTERLEKETIYKKWQHSLEDRSPDSYTLFRCNLNRNTTYETKEGTLFTFDVDNAGFSFNDRARAYAEQCIHEEDRERYITFLNSDTMLASYYRGKRSDTLEYRELTPSGDVRWLRVSADLVESANSTDVEAYLMFENIDAAKKTELHTKALSETDPLTGILNRATFAAKANALLRASKPGTMNALLMLDIDGFKQVNDVFGHTAGDQVLIDLANDLASAMRRDDLVGRLGGDEFMVFLPNIRDNRAASAKARQICALARKSFSLEVQISASVGITMAPDDGTDFDALYKKADSALYYVKGSGKDKFAFYNDDMADEHLEPEPDSAIPGKRQTEKKRRMLIVDDSAIDHELIQNIFHDEFIIEKAKDGNTALIRLRHYGSAISVVLLDLNMPGLDGFAVLKKIEDSAELRSVPVIIVSGDESRETCLEAIRRGATDFITKPVDADLLRIRVHSAVSRAENERLRAKNSLLEALNDERIRYDSVLESAGITFAMLDWRTGEFAYHSSMSRYLLGTYDSRPFWQILLSDMKADAKMVQELQSMAHSVAGDQSLMTASMEAELKTPQNETHRFRISVRRLPNELPFMNRLVITLVDMDYSAAAE